MHAPSIWGILIVGLLALILFGRPGKLSSLMKDMGEGIKGFRKGLSDEDAAKQPQPPANSEPARQLPDQTKAPETAASRDKTSA